MINSRSSYMKIMIYLSICFIHTYFSMTQNEAKLCTGSNLFLLFADQKFFFAFVHRPQLGQTLFEFVIEIDLLSCYTYNFHFFQSTKIKYSIFGESATSGAPGPKSVTKSNYIHIFEYFQ